VQVIDVIFQTRVIKFKKKKEGNTTKKKRSNNCFKIFSLNLGLDSVIIIRKESGENKPKDHPGMSKFSLLSG